MSWNVPISSVLLAAGQRASWPLITQDSSNRAVSGREVTFQSEMGASSEAGRIGDIVRVRYRPDQPHVAEIDSFMSLWGLTLPFGVLGAVFLFVSLGILSGSLSV
jgi:Protein of unknown function (DUF3592)